ncbi:sensor histidine kinase [Sulfurovum sp. NBC37-1]|uniref:sensor histidine kinase n=1 Tax=Sulfurovum sp. (strain NBC37-1) TaxID=387093 RepID=UPI000158757E|nr:HAMP domain-containing sensor histidine kinase [Sulfurovum sp. NBC37-1]BAF72141.1 two-component sensor histidine kinase [Sulfurovum sp. NBC37-1]
MSIKKLLLISYIIAGFIISIFTAFMTFYIIDVPIGMKMFSKIVITISIVLPVIALLSYLIGSYFSKKFADIQKRLILISKEDFTLYDKNEYIDEITEINKILNTVSIQLENSINELKEKNSELTWMVRSFAHDFRTPLTIIQGNIEAIEDGLVANENIPLVLEKVKYETHYMNELLSDVLLFIGSMKSVVKKEKIQLKEFIDKEIFVLLVPDASVTLINAMKEEDEILFTKTDLKKIIINLLDNSIKFTTKGSITIALENNSLIVQDTGTSIETKECEKIFQPFYTVDESKNRLKSGFGLGLAITKNLAQKNDYSLACDTKYKNGFKIALIPQ